MKKPRILVVGSSNTDMIVRVPRIPKPGETILGGAFITAPGGKGANQAVAAARAGGDVTFIARLGDDDLGNRAMAGFKRDKIRTNHVVRDRRHPSGVAFIFVDNAGENSIAVAPGANGLLTPADVKRAERAFSGADLLVIQLETPLGTVTTSVRLAVKRGVPVLLNPAPAQALPDALLRGVSILTPNENEAELLTGIKVTDDRTAARASDQLRLRGVRTVVITLGARGAFVSDDEGGRRVLGFAVEAVDTTAAGDIFNGALAVALAGGSPLPHAIRFANAAAALSVSRVGAQPSAPTRMEIDRFLTEHNRTTRPHLSPDRGTSRPAAPPQPTAAATKGPPQSRGSSRWRT